MFDDFFLISFVPILTGLFSALPCTLVGNILILRKQAMLSDTISHVSTRHCYKLPNFWKPWILFHVGGAGIAA